VTLTVVLAVAALVLAYAHRLNTTPLLMTEAWVPYGSDTRRWPNPTPRTTPVPDTPTATDELPVGDLVNTTDQPALDTVPVHEPVKVFIDVTRAQTGDGDHALIVQLPNGGDLNAAQAEQLRLALDLAVPWLAQTRGLQGHPS
jgi:hypothetical protein